MNVLPAIDLLDGQCVRLVQGRYDRLIRYQRDPLDVARGFRDAGAAWVHVVDLNGARDGRASNFDTLKQIASLGLHVEFGGGVRDDSAIQSALDAGANRVIVGTRALEDRAWFAAAAARWPGRLCVGLDALQGKLLIRGGARTAPVSAIQVAEAAADWPIAALIYTDVGRDGMLLGPNLEAIRDLAQISRRPVVASGGVTDLSDVECLAKIRLEGIVVGRALYEGTLDLAAALRTAGTPSA